MNLITCLLGIALSASGTDGGTDAGISLHFDWPVGLAAQVEHFNKLHRDDKLWETKLRYQIDVVDGKDGLRKMVPSHRENVALTGSNIRVMTVIFDGDGAFRGYEVPTDDPRRRLLSKFPISEEQKKIILDQAGPSEEWDARLLWDRIVTPWAGRTIAPGEEATEKTRLRVGPSSGYKDMVSTSVLSIEVGVPCEPKAKATNCVRLKSVTKPHQLFVLLDPPMMDKRWVKERISLIADPNTLIPYSMEVRREEKSIEEMVDGGTEREPILYDGLDLDKIVFTYPVPAKKKAKAK